MSEEPVIALDAMGGDFGPEVLIPAAALALEAEPDLRFVFFGDEKQITAWMNFDGPFPNCLIRHTDKVISSDEKPSVALRNGKGSSMRMAIEAVESGEADGVVSAGNTGALMATARMILKCLPGIDRPAIASVLPSKTGDTVMLDLGANVECDAETLVQFAILGALYARVVKGLENPTVGLLNVGSEEMKGHDDVRAAAAILSRIQIPGRYVGFVEGNDIAGGTVDVVVTDGFTGNVALKVTEGVGSLMNVFLKEAFQSSLLSRMGALLAMDALKRLKRRVDPRYYNGGMFLGLNGICVKSHGGMDSYGVSRAILLAARLVRNKYNERVAAEIRALPKQEKAVASASKLAHAEES